ncbi:hypothetical protein [Parvularcula lutaonensis]|uniref:Uncharacterized protein n=1 Tax=Parvularcula lutaonensis TaxID=491923 RepID=A0ABV7M904_9PROT|nr:hypothetical protein [Parvularcula lutaonensis]GGY41032.1 hypothetical protein GCM10007148_07010 [Parvularcula lutaonensis]
MRIFGKALAIFALIFGPAILYGLFVALARLLYAFGGCQGALGSGISCIRGDSFGNLAVQAELSVLMAIPALVIIWAMVSAALIFAIWFFSLISRPFRRSGTA